MLFAFRWVRRLISAVVLVVLLVVGATAVSVWWVARQDDRPVSDVIIVLGASQFDGRPSSVFKARLQHARALFEQGVAPRVLTVGGGAPGDRTTEAEAGAAFLEERDVVTVAVPEGRNTLESLEAAQEVMAAEGWTTAVVVTDPWHSLRSRTMARDQGIDAQTSPTRAGPSVRTRGTQLRYIARETAAYLYYRALGRSGEAGPRAI
ncbi:MAG: uncharacterized protein JWN08_2709 [Frankiales bacterium]|nr:uncharacterized protein [Frankiales bacterium]